MQAPELAMDTQGYINLIDHVHGQERTSAENPGYRVEFLALTDFVRWNNIYLAGLISNKTVIRGELSRGEFTLYQLMYNIRPDIRYELPTAIIRAGINHESNHTVSQADPAGYVWMNSLQVSIGTKGSNYLFIREQFKPYKNQFINDLDGYVFLARYRDSAGTIWTGRYHDYEWKIGGRLRFQIGSFNKWAYFAGTDVTAWLRETGDWEYRTVLRLNLFRKQLHNFAGFYYAYHLYDTYSFDNESYLGSVGFQVIF